jgi:hypothetical protein
MCVIRMDVVKVAQWYIRCTNFGWVGGLQVNGSMPTRHLVWSTYAVSFDVLKKFGHLRYQMSTLTTSIFIRCDT